jgi:hypothetical protein
MGIWNALSVENAYSRVWFWFWVWVWVWVLAWAGVGFRNGIGIFVRSVDECVSGEASGWP